MRRLAFFLTVFVGLGPAAAFAQGFKLLDMNPRLSHFETTPDEDVTLLFNTSLDASTVNDTNIYLERLDTAEIVSASLVLGSANISNDLVTIDPDADLRFGKKYRVVIEPALKNTGGQSFNGVFPGGFDWFVPNRPLDFDRPVWDPQDFTSFFVNANVLLGFNPVDAEATNPNRPETIPGINATGAWKISTGRPEIIIADIDNGLSNFHNRDLADRLFLNAGELPPPQDGADPCDYDCNGDGRFSASDYGNDPRVDDGGRGYIDPQGLIDAFADDIDGDGNGFVDDISGWDFFRDTNTPIGVSQFEEGTHSNLVSTAAGAQADNGFGEKPGVCPDCTTMVLRVTDAVIGDLDAMAAAAEYAVAMGARVLMIPLGSFDYSAEAIGVFQDAYEAGALTIVAPGDEWGYHHLYPGAGEDIVSVHGVLPLPPAELFGFIDVSIVGFTESYCTNWGSHVDITVSTGACSSEATGNGAGMAGLIFSYALERGLDLSAEEARQLMTMTADDVKDHCFTFGGDGCRPGWEATWGYGRVNVERALLRMGVPEMGIPETIPPAVRITSPKWWVTVDPSRMPVLDVEGSIRARGRPFDYEVQFAYGGDPLDSSFVTVAAGSSTDVNGLIASVPLADVLEEKFSLREPPEDAFDKSLTLRLQARYQAADGSRILGEARKTFAINTDDDPETGWMPGMPMNIGYSGAGSPVLYDMDGDPDGRLEIVMAAGRGVIEVFKADESGVYSVMDGFPVALPADGPIVDGHSSAPAVADLFGDGVPIIVTATTAGKVFAVWPDGNNHDGGPFVPGFPVSADPRPNTSPLAFAHGNSFPSAPTIGDLDGDGTLDIVAASYDQQVYAWSPRDEDESGEADPLPGWPVLARSTADQVDPDKVCDDLLPAQILASPALAILDPDSSDPDFSTYPAVIVGTSEACGSTSRLYAIAHDGYDNADGPFLEGFPVIMPAPLGSVLPIPPLTVGTTSSPAVLTRDDHSLVVSAAFLYAPTIAVVDDGVTDVETAFGAIEGAVSAHPSFGRLAADEEPSLFMPMGAALSVIDGKFALLDFVIDGWNFDAWNDAVFRERLDDMALFQNPTIADLDGDGLNEVIAGSMGYLMRAWNRDGAAPAGWPKYTQNAHIASGVVADVDADGLFEVVTQTLEGGLFGWETAGPACGENGLNAEWWSSHHDERNTSWYGHDTLPPSLPLDFHVYFTDDPDVFEIVMTAPGDDGFCGTATAFDLRYTTTPPDRKDLAAFDAATMVDAAAPGPGGEEQRFTVTAPGAEAFALRALDDAGNLGWPGPFVAPTDAPPPPDDDDDDTSDDDDADDDDADDDDTEEDPVHYVQGDDDDDDDDGCGCGSVNL